eukprot:TRINITY_DN1520_c0_g1_i1.p1 TRINITY_DN1520_c0_g1~~TRINITY_DN1520_c0_g1_i1.p1  ORF type:complete len:422 (+),score=209.40 TRINITY_DN1520_c0_g1_i1:424-1689(+)
MYHLGVGMHRGMPMSIATNTFLPGLSSLGSFWTSDLNAATDAPDDYIYLFKGNYYLQYLFAPRASNRRVVANGTLADFNLPWPRVDAAISDHEKYIDFYYNGMVARYDWDAEDLVAGYPKAARPLGVLNDPTPNACLVPDCAACAPVNLKQCQTCKTGFKPFMGGLKCINQTTTVSLKFDPTLDSDEASRYLITSIPNANIVPGMLVNTNALMLTGLKVQLKPIQSSMSGFSVGFWLNLQATTSARQVLLSAETGVRGFNSSKFEVALILDTTTSGYIVRANFLGQQVDSAVQMPASAWQHVIVRFAKAVLTIDIEGEKASVPFEVDSASGLTVPSVSFLDWSLGDTTQGVSGTLDQFALQDESTSSSSSSSGSDNNNIGMVVGVVVGGVAFIALIAIGVVLYRKRNSSQQNMSNMAQNRS